jgi:hypothetical protein
MSPPPAASRGRTAFGRLADALRRRLRPAAARDSPPATVPGLGSGEETAIGAAARDEPARSAEADAPAAGQAGAVEPAAPAEPGARIDAARERLRSQIAPPVDPEPDGG